MTCAIGQSERNVGIITNRAMGVAENGVGLMGSLAGNSVPLIYAIRDSTQMASAPARTFNETMINNIASDARVDNLRRARGEHIENYDFNGQMRIDAAERYAKAASGIANTQAATNITAARTNRDLSTGGVERGYRQQVQGINSAYELNLESN